MKLNKYLCNIINDYLKEHYYVEHNMPSGKLDHTKGIYENTFVIFIITLMIYLNKIV